MQDTPASQPRIVKQVGSIKQTCPLRSVIAPQVIGHTRKATVGAITVPNAHPFHIGYTVGAHNGHIQEHREMNKKYDRNYEVDSQHLIAHIDKGLPIESLGGSGTVVYLDTRKPHIINFGRGAFSDLEVFSLGPADNPWGTVWASIGSWVEDALDMSGVDKWENWTTYAQNAYYLDNHQLMEAGRFPLMNTYTQQWQGRSNLPTHYSPRGHNCGLTPQDLNSKEWTESKSVDEYWKKVREREIAQGKMVTGEMRSDLLPDVLKKSPEIIVLGDNQVAQAPAKTFVCDGCRRDGELADSYSLGADKIVYDASVNEHLCYMCYSLWDEETSPKIIGVPELRLNME